MLNKMKETEAVSITVFILKETKTLWGGSQLFVDFQSVAVGLGT
jgi:hypothetical protein